MKAGGAFACRECGFRTAKWLGRCPECGAWNSLMEQLSAPDRAAGLRRGPIPFADIDEASAPRIRTGLSEFDRALGGGVVPGSLVLIGGDPGVGKSTLLLQASSHLAGKPGMILYASGEESEAQVKMRGDRLKVRSEGLLFLPETEIGRILEACATARPSAVVIDSIQTVHAADLPSPPGSLAQVRETAARLLSYAKGNGVPVFIIGHVTKDGAIAGPRSLEHVVDAVLYLEGDRHHLHRILRAVKNRFGPTDEIGIFEMTGEGLVPVADPSRLFLGDPAAAAPGSAVLPTLEGTRPILVEIQVLAAEPGAGQGRRVALGVDAGRVALLVAVVERRLGASLAGRDIYVNVAGGFQIQDPAADLAVAAALASSLAREPLPPRTLVFGEIGLTGEVRPVARALPRLHEGARLGFRAAVFPRGNAEGAPERPEPRPVATLEEALTALLPRGRLPGHQAPIAAENAGL